MHTSLDKFSEKYSSRIAHKYLVYTKDLKKDGDTLCVPIYMVPLLPKTYPFLYFVPQVTLTSPR